MRSGAVFSVVFTCLALLLSGEVLAGFQGYPASIQAKTIRLTGNAVIGGGVVDGRACSDGYTRVAPNHCQLIDINTYGPATGMTRDACLEVTAPATAKALEVYVKADAGAAAVAPAPRYSFIQSWHYPGCLVISKLVAAASGFELAGIGAGSILTSDTATVVLPLMGTEGFAKMGGKLYLRFVDDTGNNGAAYVWVLGYFD